MNRILIAGLIAIFPIFLTAQNSEVGFLFGTSAYSGDLDKSTRFLSQGENHAALGIFARFDLNRFVAARANFTYGKISASDANSNSPALRARNLSFQSNITELSTVAEFNPLGTNSRGARIQPYIYVGVAFFRFKPEAVYAGQLLELQPLGTEGQSDGERYRLNQIAIPLGLGFKFRLTERVNIGMDVGLRKTFTDYLDDVSGSYVTYSDLLRENGSLAAALGNREGELIGDGTEPVIRNTGDVRGNPDTKDWYYTAGVTVSYQLFGKVKNFKGRNPTGREFGCPNGL